jgi:hypothetical protein
MDKLRREKRTLIALTRIYCNAHHGKKFGMCCECNELAMYAMGKIGRCSFGKNKPICNRCTVHCFHPDYREEMKKVMRYSGPRIIWRHPILALRYYIRKIKP